MKNKEKFSNEIADIFISSDGRIAINKRTGEPVACHGFDCGSCLFGNPLEDDCKFHLKEWAESEYKEPITIYKEPITIERLAEVFNQEYPNYDIVVAKVVFSWILNCYTLTEKEAEE